MAEAVSTTDTSHTGPAMRSEEVAQERVGETVVPGEWVGAEADTILEVDARSSIWHRLGLTAIMILAAGLHSWRLDQNGYGNEYYAAAVRSMLTSWHNFFFASYDAGGFVTVDKPPLGLWIQAASAWLFGFNGVSLMLPQVVAGFASVALIYYLTRRVFGPTAGLVAALTLALTPISIASNRSNILDPLLVFAMLLAAWATTLAAERASLRLLLLGFGLVGVAFNIKMMQAYLVLPALYLLYLLGARLNWHKRLLHLSLASLLLVAVSLSWAVVVDLTPAENRPYIGSSQANSVLELATGYNGLKRIFGGEGPGPGPGGPATIANGGPGQIARAPSPPGGPVEVPLGGAPIGGPGDGVFDGGGPGLLRLYERELGGQASWLLPMALFGMVATAWQRRPGLPLDHRHAALVLWGGWLLACAVAFSMASGIFHSYYLVTLAPPLAALVGAGMVTMWRDYRQHRVRGWLLPMALLTTAALQVIVLLPFPQWSAWLAPIVVSASLMVTGALVLCRLARTKTRRWLPTAAALALLALFIAPGVWSATPVLARGSGLLPFAGPDLLNPQMPFGPTHGMEQSGSSKLIDYLRANRNGERYLVAMSSAGEASPMIIQTGEAVMAMGGFSGSDSILTPQKLADLVRSRAVRYFLLHDIPEFGPGSSPPGGGIVLFAGMGPVQEWVQSNCKKVSAELWRDEPAAGAIQPRPGQPPDMRIGPGSEGMQLYDCAAR
jgi:4-amino-4-deoxy-L-arabinose transferase-like glycosyltransferase